AVADDRNDLAFVALAKPGLGHPERVAERGRGMAVLDLVVGGLAPRRVSGQSVALPQSRELGRAAGDHLVDVGLVAGVPHDRVLRTVEHAMQGKGQLDHAQVGREMAAGPGDLLDEERSHLDRELRELLLVQALQVGGRVDPGQQAHVWFNARLCPRVPPSGGYQARRSATSSSTWATRSFCRRARAAEAMCRRQPGLSEATIVQPVFWVASSFPSA